MFTKWVLLVEWLWFVILAGTDLRRNSYGQFWSTKIQSKSDGQFCASDTQTDTQTDTHTDTLLIFISIEDLFLRVRLVSTNSYVESYQVCEGGFCAKLS